MAPAILVAVLGLATAQADAVDGKRQLERLETQDPAYFSDPVCPGIGGLPADLAVAVLGEARSLLDQNGVETGADGQCEPNLFIIVTPDTGEAVKSLKRSQPTVFNNMSAPDVRRLTDGSAPVRAFRSSILRGADGRSIQTGGDQVHGQSGARGGEQLSVTSSSRISGTTRRDVEQSFVYIEAEAIKGLTLRQIGHYAAMVGTLPLASSRLDDIDQPSILTLFSDPDDRQAEATAFDKALLAAAR